MADLVIAARVDDPELKKLNKNAIFEYRIIDNSHYTIDNRGSVKAVKGYTPKVGDEFTVEVTYKCGQSVSTARRTFTVKI